MGEIKFPSNSVIKDAELNGDGDIILSVGSKESTEKNREKNKMLKENDEIREILFKNAKDDVGKKFLLYVYKEIAIPEHGVSMTLDMRIPMETLENVDVESYIKERVQGGYAYTCHVKDMSGSWPKNGNRECLRYFFENDGALWLEKNNKGKKRDELLDFGGAGKNDTNILDVANVIKDAYSESASSKKDDEQTNNKMFELITNLVSSVSNKPRDNSTVELLTVMTPIITELIKPKNDNNQTVEALRMISESMRDIGKSIAETNLKIAEKEREAAETRYKDKLEMLELVKNSGNNGNGGFADQAIKMLDMSNKMNSLVMSNMLGLFRNAVDMKEIISGGKPEAEEEVSVGKMILDKVLSPEMWKTGVDTFNALRGQKEESQEENPDEEEPLAADEVEEVEEIQDIPKTTTIIKKRGNDMKDKKSGELLNDIVSTILANISQDVDHLVNHVFDKYKDSHNDMREMLKISMSEGAKLLKPRLILKVTKNITKLQKVLDGLKEKFSKN